VQAMLRIQTGKKSSIPFRFHAYTVIKKQEMSRQEWES
jgi:hypothetical protein